MTWLLQKTDRINYVHLALMTVFQNMHHVGDRRHQENSQQLTLC